MTTETLKSLYQRDNWRLLLNDLFGSNFKAFSRVEDLQVENQTAKSAVQLGEITLASGDVLAVYEVELQDHIQVERNKVAIRNLLRTYWNKYDGAFIASYKPTEKVWRFSFVSETRQYDEDGNYGKVTTAAKRFTYVLGQGEGIRTATERFNILAATGRNTTLEDIKGAFNVEKMSKDFFDNYKKQYELFCEYMLSKTGIRQAVFNGDEKAIRDFNKKLLGRIVFLYFIQKKGWLGVPKNGEWGDGDTNFLTNLFKKYEHPELFYSNILTLLFFDTLNKKRDNDLIELIKGYNYKIPFLNGGLFEEDNKKHREIIFPKEQFHNLFEFFNQYNFTIYEDDPNDHTVAVDPEMLGHIFENLLEDNKDKGAFYTPKEIVHYMCQESLIEYLCTTLQIEDEAKEREAITKLIKTKEIDDILKPEIQNLNKALDKVKICDPAIGSGAFPMGLLHEIFAVKLTLYIFENNTSEGFDAAAVKLNIIQNSIYGVDIEPGAVDIARLRFWLSLIVDEPEPKPLPNLDYKIVVGNSLVSKLDDDIIDIDWSLNNASQDLFATDLVKEKSDLLEKISHKQKLFFSSDCDKKKLSIDIRNLKIDLLINQLNLMNQKLNIPIKPSPEYYLNKPKAKFIEDTAKYLQCVGRKDKIKKLEILKTKADETLHFFDWKLDFPEIMNEQVAGTVGFDIVIANPPYVNIANISDEIYRSYIQTKYNTVKNKSDLYSVFIEKSYTLLRDNAKICFIYPKTWMGSDSFSKYREFIINNFKIHTIINLGYGIFENATVSTVISIFSKLNVDSNEILLFQIERNENGQISLIEQENKLTYSQIKSSPQYLFSFTKPILLRIKTKKLIEFVDFSLGIKTSNDRKFIIDFKKDDSTYLMLRGKNIRKYEYDKPSEYIWYKPNLMMRKVGAGPRKLEYFLKDKILIQTICNGILRCAYDSKKYLVNDKIHIAFNPKDYSLKVILAILNSNLMSYITKSFFGNYLEIKINQLEVLPIPEKISKSTQKSLVRLVDDRLSSHNPLEISTLEFKIDNIVYKLYDLTYDEVKVVDPYFELSEEEYAAIKID